ncbi:hypothetical protein [Treponema phagedenis]|uniref:hypothetical protein n=1 Tax=Treponema phagedenis TaxID=162 RepID=UPI0011E6334B|nr:hypothetical protein [Treponema phagedenis]QEK07775.1 hypothetical protein FUT80_14350 [Treponema phagedenis]
MKKTFGLRTVLLIGLVLSVLGIFGGCKQNKPATVVVAITGENVNIPSSIVSVGYKDTWATVKTRSEFARVTAQAGYELAGWKLNNADGEDLSDSYAFTKPLTCIFAVLNHAEISITIDGDANLPADRKKTFQVGKYSSWQTIKETPEIRDIQFAAGFELDQWYLTNMEGNVLTGSETFSENTTVFAVLKQKGTQTTKPISITIDGDANLPADRKKTFQVGKYSSWQTIKETPEIRDIQFAAGFELDQWYLTNMEGNVLTGSETFSENTTVFAVLKQKGTQTTKPISITIDGDSNFPEELKGSIGVKKGTGWATVKNNPTVQKIEKSKFKEGYEFALWQLRNADGSFLTDDYQFDEDTTIFAQSKKEGTATPVPITITLQGDAFTKLAANTKITVEAGKHMENNTKCFQN